MKTRIQPILLLALFTLFALLGVEARAQTQPDIRIFLQLEGTIQGPIEGETGNGAYDGHIECFATEHELYRSQSSQAIQHGTFKYVQRMNGAAVKILQALNTDESLTATFKYLRPGEPYPDGSTNLIEYSTITLTNAIVMFG